MAAGTVKEKVEQESLSPATTVPPVYGGDHRSQCLSGSETGNGGEGHVYPVTRSWLAQLVLPAH